VDVGFGAALARGRTLGVGSVQLVVEGRAGTLRGRSSSDRWETSLSSAVARRLERRLPRRRNVPRNPEIAHRTIQKQRRPRCAGPSRCAEEDSNLHPVIPDQALNLVTRMSYPSAARQGVRLLRRGGRYGRFGRSGRCQGCCRAGNPLARGRSRSSPASAAGSRWRQPQTGRGCCAKGGDRSASAEALRVRGVPVGTPAGRYPVQRRQAASGAVACL
jgi:hypothetical protein